MVALSHKNSARTLQKCLEGLQAQDYPDFKVVIIDAGSTDGSTEIAKKFTERDPRFIFQLLEGCTEGEGEAWSVKNHPADVILFTNSDIYTPPYWVSLHVSWHERGYDMVGGKQAYIGDKYDFAWSTYRSDRVYDRMAQGMSLGFTNFSTTKEFYDRIGGIDASLTSGTDMDFFLRGIKANAMMALDPRLEVVHDHPLGSFYWCFRKAFRYGMMQSNLLRFYFGKPWDWPPEFRLMSTQRLFPGAYWYYGARTWVQQREVLKSMTGKDGRPMLEFLVIAYAAVGWAYQLGAIFAAMQPPNMKLLRERRIKYGNRS